MNNIRIRAALGCALLALGGLFAAPALASCKHCGTVVEVKTNKNQGDPKATTSYQVLVKMEDGNVRSFNYGNAPGYKVGDKVRIANKRLVRQ